ncbi:hypothetical protein A0H81_14766 [Grifola frondosa]|uniref:Uncharacterized protein n=1 Tax=Grifola frondosa TaxID=5627 RepID=A0A1C7LM90_GRIFR|nr:hypothetical protein A0H81_14766 [Grifola frondosa]
MSASDLISTSQSVKDVNQVIRQIQDASEQSFGRLKLLISTLETRVLSVSEELEKCRVEKKRVSEGYHDAQQRARDAERKSHDLQLKVEALQAKLSQREASAKKTQSDAEERRAAAERLAATAMQGKVDVEKQLQDVKGQLLAAKTEALQLKTRVTSVENDLAASTIQKADTETVRRELEQKLQESLAKNERASKIRRELQKKLQESKEENELLRTRSHTEKLEEANRSPEEKFINFETMVSKQEQFAAPNWRTSSALFPEQDFSNHNIRLSLPKRAAELCSRNGYLYLPGCLKFCSGQSRAAFIVQPSYTYSSRNRAYFSPNEKLAELSKQTREVFHNSDGEIYYVGTYECLRYDDSGLLKDQTFTRHINSTLDDMVRITATCGKTLQPLIKDAYEMGILKVEMLGLRCVGFNDELYNAMLPTVRNLKREHVEDVEDDLEDALVWPSDDCDWVSLSDSPPSPKKPRSSA